MNRPKQPNCRYEPPFPDHATVLCAMSAPDLVTHSPTEQCAVEVPHLISECKEFEELSVGVPNRRLREKTVKCPHCGKPIPSKLAAKALGAVKSERKAASSVNNGKLGGRPRKPR